MAWARVYAAYDPRLDRKIALELLREGNPTSPATLQRRQARLLREAGAMAKLSHPNVGVVHDVGVWSADPETSIVWIAIELIDGEDVRKWCRRASPNAREILGAYVQLGRGLAAAHDAGLVHRDVKPDNAMRDREGRVRVLDFGLAHLAMAEGPQPAPDLRELAQIDLEDPYHLPDGSLNACLVCDEENSGNVFKSIGGRTRRNTGLPNALCRSCEEVRPITHDWAR